MKALELAVRHRMIVDRDRQSPTPGSSDGPLGTAHERSTSPHCKRKSKCSVVASCNCTTKRVRAARDDLGRSCYGQDTSAAAAIRRLTPLVTLIADWADQITALP